MQTTLLFKTDKKLKQAAQKVAGEMGIPLSAYLNEQLRELTTRRRAVFCAPMKMNAKTEKEVRQAIKDVKAGRNVAGPFTPDEMDRYLDSL